MSFKICVSCGASLDPGEKCDCGATETESTIHARSSGTIPMVRKSFTPGIGEVYTLYGGKGQKYRVLGIEGIATAKLQSVASYWTFIAHGIGRYDDGSIDWNFSSGGYFAEEVFK